MHRKPSAYGIFITVLVILLILCIALFIYGSATNTAPQITRPGHGTFAWGMMIRHG